jgi:hypothetical protein
MQQTISHSGLNVLWQCFKEINIKSGSVATKTKIGEQFEINMEPIKYKERTKEGAVEEKELEDTGPGQERWSWSRTGSMTLTEDQGTHLREAYKKILDGEGFPAEQYKGVGEVENLLTNWCADKGEDKPKEE